MLFVSAKEMPRCEVYPEQIQKDFFLTCMIKPWAFQVTCFSERESQFSADECSSSGDRTKYDHQPRNRWPCSVGIVLVSPLGGGKTLIAVVVVDHFLREVFFCLVSFVCSFWI